MQSRLYLPPSSSFVALRIHISKELMTVKTAWALNRSAIPGSFTDTRVDITGSVSSGFFQVYGWMGVPMVITFLCSSAWTFVLAAMQVAPTAIANYVMRTGELDFGEFWLLRRAEAGIAIPATILLVAFAIGYMFLVFRMIFPNCAFAVTSGVTSLLKPSGSVKNLSRTLSCSFSHQGRVSAMDGFGLSTGSTEEHNRARCRFMREISTSGARLHRLVNDDTNTFLVVPKLAIQTSTLLSYLGLGFPPPLVFSYLTLLFINCIIASYRSLSFTSDPKLIMRRFFYSFDLFFAVFAPLQVLIYAQCHFKFDYSVFETRVATLSVDSFDRTARLFADPTKVSLTRIAFRHLQFSSYGSLFMKSVLNVFTIYRWWRTIEHLITLQEGARPHSFATLVTPTVSSPSVIAVQAPVRRWKKFVLGSSFIVAGFGIIAYAAIAFYSTRRICEKHQKCEVISYQWSVGETYCPCLVFISRDNHVSTMTKWENPDDVTEELAQLAAAGRLTHLQIINRQVPELPPELQKCKDLEWLSLIYTKTRIIPDWASIFTRLEYLHIEGDLTSKQLTYMPHDLFSGMSHLLFLHLGCLLELKAVPDLSHLVRLEYMVLVMLHSVSEIPSLDKLVSLKKLSIMDDIRIMRLPSMRDLRKLNTFALSYRVPVCCNGYLDGKCDLSAFSCRNRTSSGEPFVECSSDRISDEDYAVLTSTSGLVCPPNLPFDVKDLKPTVASTDDACGGVMYRQCWVGGLSGMCYPARMQVLYCQLDPDYEKMRRLQIAKGVGDVCDPDVEAWLGCVKAR